MKVLAEQECVIVDWMNTVWKRERTVDHQGVETIAWYAQRQFDLRYAQIIDQSAIKKLEAELEKIDDERRGIIHRRK